MLQVQLSEKAEALRGRLLAFMDEFIYPNERHWDDELEANTRAGNRWQSLQLVERLKLRAKEQGLWNLWWPKIHGGVLSNVEYAVLCEIMGRVHWAPEVFNCSPPDTGNMETLLLYGDEEQKKRWLEPLADGIIRSGFAMTEPEVASSDATNICARIERQGDCYLLNGRKWWVSGAMNPRCEIFIFMGKTNPEAPKHRQQAMILVPRNAPGVRVVRSLNAFGYDDAPVGRAEVLFENVRVPVTNMLLGDGRGFEIAQGRLGPGRVHHCMRLLGVAERALEYMCRRSLSRVAFGRPLAEQTVTQERIAEARIMIDSARLLTLKTAHMMDIANNKAAKAEIAMIKVYVPNVACRVLDWAIQAHGGGGICDDFPLARMFAEARAIRFVDGPDEVHRNQVARLELAKYRPPVPSA
jgi:acyl-CoA dehydrogenase